MRIISILAVETVGCQRLGGWLKDKYGLSWVVPRLLDELLADHESTRAQRAMTAMLSVKKIDIAELERAVAEAPSHASA